MLLLKANIQNISPKLAIVIPLIELILILLLFVLFIVRCGSLIGLYRLLIIIRKILPCPFRGKNLTSV